MGNFKTILNPDKDCICVDGSWNSVTKQCEYQGVHRDSKKRLFHQGPFEGGTNNIVEFLAVVHALAYCKKNNISTTIYSDSLVAICWIDRKQCNTNTGLNEKNKKLFDLIERAEKWLRENDSPCTVKHWKTKRWGENPADFGRK